MSDIAKQSGIFISGQVSDVRDYTSKNTGEVKYSVRLFVPGSELITIGLAGQPDPKRFIPGELVKLRVSMGSYNGKIFFNEAQ